MTFDITDLLAITAILLYIALAICNVYTNYSIDDLIMKRVDNRDNHDNCYNYNDNEMKRVQSAPNILQLNGEW